jgi:hypothetical protein
MKTFMKIAAGVGLAGALAFAAATPSSARHGHNAAAIGFGVGAAVGAAAAGAAYNGGYYYGPGYDCGYDCGYAYAPGPVYVEPYDYGYGAGYHGYYGYQPGGKDMSIDSQR